MEYFELDINDYMDENDMPKYNMFNIAIIQYMSIHISISKLQKSGSRFLFFDDYDNVILLYNTHSKFMKLNYLYKKKNFTYMDVFGNDDIFNYEKNTLKIKKKDLE